MNLRLVPIAIVSLVAAACSSSRPPTTDGAGGPRVGQAPDPAKQQQEQQPGAPYPNGPPGPYGTQVGDTLPNLEFVGRVSFTDPPGPAATYEWKTLTFDDLHHSGKRFALVFFSAVWCGPCKANAQGLQNAMPPLKDKGAVFVQVLVDGSDPDVAPTQKVVDAWAEATGVTFTTVMDPPDKPLRSKGLFEWDRAIVIDLETMELVFWGTPPAALEELKAELGT